MFKVKAIIGDSGRRRGWGGDSNALDETNTWNSWLVGGACIMQHNYRYRVTIVYARCVGSKNLRDVLRLLGVAGSLETPRVSSTLVKHQVSDGLIHLPVGSKLRRLSGNVSGASSMSISLAGPWLCQCFNVEPCENLGA